MNTRTIAVAGGSGLIGGAIVRRLARIPGIRVRVLSRNPAHARARFQGFGNLEFTAADVNEADALGAALIDTSAIVNAVAFDGYPIENPRRGLTFDRVDYGGTLALLDAAKRSGATQFIYISGAAASENSTHPAFRAKGRAERAIRESGLAFTIFRPSLVYGPDDKVVNLLAKTLRLTPVMLVPGTGEQKVQPLLVDDLAACVALALNGRGRNGTFEIGGPDPMTFDALMRLLMEISGRRRAIVHVPAAMLNVAGRIAEMFPGALFSRDAANFLLADNACDNAPLVAEFGISLTPAREGLVYLARK